MSLFRWPELLRAPEGEGAPAVTTIVAEPAVIVPIAPLTVDPGSGAVADLAPADPAIVAEPVVAAAAPAAPAPGAELTVAPTPGLLSSAKTLAEIKAAPPAPAVSSPAPAEGGDPALGAVPAKPAEKVEPQPKPPIAYEAFKLPQGVEATDPVRIKAFTDILASDPEARVSQKMAQALFDLHVGEVQRQVAEREALLIAARDKYWADKNAQWQQEVRNDPKLRNRLEYNLAVGKTVILQESVSQKDANAILEAMIANGFTNFPPFIRMMVNIGEKLNVMEDGIVAPTAPVNGATRSRAEKWYETDGMTPKA